MAYFAEIDDSNLVVRVLALADADTVDANGAESELVGAEYLSSAFGGRWRQTSYNTRGGVHALGGDPLRKNFAGIGYTFDPDRNAFIPPRPFASWLLDEATCTWNPPVPYPDFTEEDGKPVMWNWDEEGREWVKVILEALND
tara:strand:+ start:1051 stop:1476 length:426 start_codon:yes stop_codon:yes gene_type:complete